MPPRARFLGPYIIYLIGVSTWVTIIIGLTATQIIPNSVSRPAAVLGIPAVYLLTIGRILHTRPETIPYHLLVAALLANSGYALVHLYRLLSYDAGSTPWEEVIFISATRFNSILDIFSPSNLQHPPYSISIYSPLYYVILRFTTTSMGHFLVIGRYLSTIGLLAIVIIAWFLSSRYIRSLVLLPPLFFLAIFPTLCWSGS